MTHDGAMQPSHDLFNALSELLAAEMPGLSQQGTTMQVVLEWRYGRVTVRLDFDAATESIRLYTVVPPPAGAGSPFLLFCLATNTLYWDVKIGLDAQGMLLVHADVDLDQADLTMTARVLIERVVTMRELLDDDFVSYLLQNKLATTAQHERWSRG